MAQPKVIIIGGGLSGLMAALKICEKGVPVSIFSVVPFKRSHTVCAEGGMNAALNTKGEADSVARLKSLETSSDAGVLDFFSLAEGKTARHMEPFMIAVNPAPLGEHSLSSHEGEEFVYVLEGEIEIEYGKDLHVLAPGDSIYYDSIVPHQLRAHGDAPARILAVVYAPA